MERNKREREDREDKFAEVASYLDAAMALVDGNYSSAAASSSRVDVVSSDGTTIYAAIGGNMMATKRD